MVTNTTSTQNLKSDYVKTVQHEMNETSFNKYANMKSKAEFAIHQFENHPELYPTLSKKAINEIIETLKWINDNSYNLKE